mmetsp:Transcript_30552/g.36312  ORF Transcript_30552/g.36312 Transcript_30552/m.36312 type:complete len:346 (+) Transcript_30552:79-1116(+)
MKMKTLITSLFPVLVIRFVTAIDLDPFPHVESSFEIYTIDKGNELNACMMHSDLVSSLQKNGFTKVVCPFGILLFATDEYPDNLLKYGANIIANMIDADNDGLPDNPDVKNALAHLGRYSEGYALVCGTSSSEERQEEHIKGLKYTFSCQTWKGESDNDSEKAIMFEEAFHMMNSGWADIYPDIFGFDSFEDSLICRETARLQCVRPGWWHPENTCPVGAPFSPGSSFVSSPLSPGAGDCTEPSCDCAEFYRQAMTLYMDWDDLPFWYSEYMPRTKNEFKAMASDELLAMMADPQYNQPQVALSGIYTSNVLPLDVPSSAHSSALTLIVVSISCLYTYFWIHINI